jgi:hypothetical protein
MSAFNPKQTYWTSVQLEIAALVLEIVSPKSPDLSEWVKRAPTGRSSTFRATGQVLVLWGLRLNTERQRKPPALSEGGNEMSLMDRRAVVASGAALASSAIAQSA